jgi:hypothetical protein
MIKMLEMSVRRGMANWSAQGVGALSWRSATIKRGAVYASFCGRNFGSEHWVLATVGGSALYGCNSRKVAGPPPKTLVLTRDFI